MAASPARRSATDADQIREVILDMAEMQLAAMNAGITFWTSWVESATAFSSRVSRELSDIASGKRDSGDVIGSLVDTNRAYLREMSELPDRAAARFRLELEAKNRATSGKRATPRKRVRRAKAKN